MAFIDRLSDAGVLARLSTRDPHRCLEICHACFDGGLRGVLLSICDRHCLSVVERLATEAPAGTLIGVSCLSNPDSLSQVRDAGACFAASPHFDPELMATAIVTGLPLIAGAFTPTEIYQTWDAGAVAVQLFPAHVLGPEFLSMVRCSLPDIPLIPSHGVTLDNMQAWLRAGATAVCIDDQFIDGDSEALSQAVALALAKHNAWKGKIAKSTP